MFSIDDGHAVFYDVDALGTVLRAGPLIDAIANANRAITGRRVRTGERPRIHFHPGRGELLVSQTAIGRVEVMNLVDETMGSPRRVALESRIALEISWTRPIELKTALSRVDDLIRFLELVTGRPQNRNNLLLKAGDGEAAAFLGVYSALAER